MFELDGMKTINEILKKDNAESKKNKRIRKRIRRK